MKEVSDLSNGRVKFSTSSLYGMIRRLLEQGWIKRIADPEPDPTDREQKVYTLTDKGRKLVNAEVERLNSLLNSAEQRTSESPS
jgi:DNA-binding PadR family transcriptional regulator